MENPIFIELEAKIDALIGICSQLLYENNVLKSNQSAWQQERVQLREKNEQAKIRVEAMIAKLKSLESEA